MGAFDDIAYSDNFHANAKELNGELWRHVDISLLLNYRLEKLSPLIVAP